MENNNLHIHWWHWLIIIIVIILALGIGYTLIHNYNNSKENHQSFINGTEQVIRHPIDSTENAINDITK